LPRFNLRIEVKKMASAQKLVSMDRGRQSVLTPELKDFIDRAIVPALVTQYLAEMESAKNLAKLRGAWQSHDRDGD
jgi:hypothetical protein